MTIEDCRRRIADSRVTARKPIHPIKQSDEVLLTHISDKRRRVAASVDLTQGPLFKRIIIYTLPIIATGLLQLLFNAADLVVVGNSTNDTALPAVGATSSLVNLIVNLLIGLSVGAGVCAARYYGARDDKSMHELVHTAIPTAAIGGLVFGIIGFVFAGTFLRWMDTPDDLIVQSTLYVRIYSVGIPFSIVYNFGAAILRSVGDTTRPLIFLVIAGVVNVLFNLAFVFLFHMDVDGVATATAISQALSAVMVIVYMMRVKDSHRFQPRKMRFYKDKFVKILVIGLPAGIQGSLFSVSNVIIQKSINAFGSTVISGNTAAVNIEGFVYTGMNAFHQTALNFTGQHLGAKKYARIKKIILLCLLSVSVIGLVFGMSVYLLGAPLLNIYSPGKEEVIGYGLLRMKYICITYFLCGIMDVLSGLLRGMGYSVSSMIITLACVCGFRILWIYTVFAMPAYHSLTVLYISYPISWGLCCIVQGGLLLFAYIRMIKKSKRDALAETEPPREASTAEIAVEINADKQVKGQEYAQELTQDRTGVQAQEHTQEPVGERQN